MAQRTESEFTLDTAAQLAAEESATTIRGRSPWAIAWRRLRRNYFAFAALAVFVLIVLVCILAPLYAHHVAHTGPNDQHVLDTVTVHGKKLDVVSAGGNISVSTGKPCAFGETNCRLVPSLPIGPQWGAAGGKFVLGADVLGRDIAVRLLYGGRNSLLVGIGSSAICVGLAILLALLAGYFGGWVDFLITRFFDLFFAFITVLLGIAVRADLTGVKQVSDAVSNVARQGPTLAAQPEDQALDPARRGISSRTVQVQLRPGEGGDRGWAARLNEAARVQIEGEAPAEIHGVVTLEGGSDARPRIGWAVNWAGTTQSCGRLTAVVVTRPEGLTNQVIGTFRRSLSRTAALKRPSCY